MPDHKIRFLSWLDRFAHSPSEFRKTFEQLVFTEEELLRLKPQIEAKWRLKKSYLEGRAKQA